MVVLDEQVEVGWRDVHVARLERLLVVGFAQAELGDGAEQVPEGRGVRVGRTVLDDDDGRAEVRGQRAQDRPERVEATPGGAERDQCACPAHVVLRYNLSSGSISS